MCFHCGKAGWLSKIIMHMPNEFLKFTFDLHGVYLRQSTTYSPTTTCVGTLGHYQCSYAECIQLKALARARSTTLVTLWQQGQLIPVAKECLDSQPEAPVCLNGGGARPVTIHTFSEEWTLN